jgi:hypothetical protein
MFTKTAIALAILFSTASGALATNQSSSTPNLDGHDCRGVYFGSNPRVLINRPQSGMCDRAPHREIPD